jgi:hypothetical protein
MQAYHKWGHSVKGPWLSGSERAHNTCSKLCSESNCKRPKILEKKVRCVDDELKHS